MTDLAGQTVAQADPGRAEGTGRDIGLNFVPRSASLAVEVARTAEQYGFDSIGFADSPTSYAEVYATLAAVAVATETISIGPYVTNPVTRHWSVHAAALRTLQELAPGRVFATFGSGDSAVRTFGLPSARADGVEQAVTQLKSALADSVPVQVAADGPRMTEVGGRCADAVVLGCGADLAALEALGDTARAAGAANSRPAPDVWVALPLRALHDAGQIPAARRDVLPVVAACANHALRTRWAQNSVPAHLREPLRGALSRYDMTAHARVSGRGGNGDLFADNPELEEYLLHRFAILGTAADCRLRLDEILALPGITGIRFSTTAADPVSNIRVAASLLAGRP